MSYLVSVNKFFPPILRISLQLSAMGSVGVSTPTAPSTIWHILADLYIIIISVLGVAMILTALCL